MSLFVVFKAGLDSWRKTQSHLEVYQSARAALDMMTRELPSAYLNPAEPTICFKGFLKGTAIPAWAKATDGSSVFFVAALNPVLNYSDAAFELCKVGYYLDLPSNTLMRYSHYNKVGATPNFNFADNTNVTLTKVASNVTDLKITYRNSLDWFLTIWDSTDSSRPDMYNKKPLTVEITLTVKEPNSNPVRTKTFMTEVCIPQ